MRETKIICTIGPKTCRFEALMRLAENGMNVARLNMSHGTLDWHRDVIRGIHGHLIKFSKDPETTIQRAIEKLKREKIIAIGDRIIVLSDMLVEGNYIETVQVRII